MDSTHNEVNSVIASGFIRTKKIYKHMTSIWKNVHINKLDDIMDEYNNTYHRTIEMKPIEVKDNTYIDFIKEFNDKDPKFKVADHIRISKYKNILLKDILQIGLKFLWLKKLKIQFDGHTLLMIWMVKKLLEHFMKKNYKKQINKDLG